MKLFNWRHKKHDAIISNDCHSKLSDEHKANFEETDIEVSHRVDTSSPEPSLMIMSDGDLGINIGGGLSLDLSDGSLGLNLGGGLSMNL